MKKINKCFSFDVFDTCLVRICGDSKGVFQLMAFEMYGYDADKVLIYDFVNARIRAENKAKDILVTSLKEDITLDEIYSFLNPAILDYWSKEKLINLEINTELKVLRPIFNTKNEIDKIHKDGQRIIYISDMYLPSYFIKELLIKYGFWKNQDVLYVSNEIGFTKSKGNLYDFISNKENILFENWHHFGDNIESDYNIPRKKGINASRIKDDGFTKYELNWINSTGYSIEPLNGILIAGIARAIRLSNERSATIDLVLNVIAPLFVPFVAWVLEDAKKRNISQLCFLARDGYLFYLIAEVLKSKYPEIKCSYIYGSRRAFYLAGLRFGSKEEFEWIMGGAIGKTPKQMMKRINLDVHILDESLNSFSITHDFYDQKITNSTFNIFINLLININVLPKILLEAKIQRNLALQYFEQEGILAESKNTAIVDLGWTKTCQQAINSIIEPKRVFGYYFGVFKERKFVNQAGEYSAGFYPEELWSEDINKTINSSFVAISEQIFAMSYHGSTIGFEKKKEKVYPVFDEIENSNEFAEKFRNELYFNIDLFTKEFSNIPLLLTNPRSLLKKYGFMSLSSFILNPTKKEVLIISPFKVGNNMNDNEKVIRFITPFVIYQHFYSESLKLIWLEGSLCYTFGKHGLHIIKFLRFLYSKFKAYFF